MRLMFRFNPDGELELSEDLAERDSDEEWFAVCPICKVHIAWCLDMFSFTTGPNHRLAHARCVWTKEAFDVEKKRAET
jgi:hypothetical protein